VDNLAGWLGGWVAGWLAAWSGCGVSRTVVTTGRVLTGFEPIGPDNRRIVLQEWLTEAFARLH
jgi:hypothetical protein